MYKFEQKPKETRQTMSAKSTIPDRVCFGQSQEVRSILRLQRTIGNQAVQKLLQSNPKELQEGSATTASMHFGHNFSRIPVFSPSPVQVQPKLPVSARGGTAAVTLPAEVCDAIKSPGQPLDGTTRDSMENLLGYDLGHVRVHTDALAARAASATSSAAFTLGKETFR